MAACQWYSALLLKVEEDIALHEGADVVVGVVVGDGVGEGGGDGTDGQVEVGEDGLGEQRSGGGGAELFVTERRSAERGGSSAVRISRRPLRRCGW